MATSGPLSGAEEHQSLTPLQLCIYGTIFFINIVSVTAASIALPMYLSGDIDMAVVFVFQCLVFFVFFSLVDVLLEPLTQPKVALPEGMIAFTALQNLVNGIGVVFGGAANRTPLTMQTSVGLVVNLASPFYKMWLLGIPFRRFTQYRWYILACVLYLGSFVLTLVDKLHQGSSGSLSPYCLLMLLGLIALMTTNVQQEKVQLHIDLEKLGPLASFKVAIAILRKQFSWLFILSWSAILLAFIPSFDQGGVMTREIFMRNWASFLPFSHMWMNIFLACWILTVFTGIFMNKYDSSFNMLTSNISSVLTLWTGWVPALMPGTVGFVPSIPLTTTAIVLSIIAIWPSYKYSLHMRDIMARHFGPTPDEHVGLIQKP